MPALLRKAPPKPPRDYRLAIGLAGTFVILCTFAFLVLVAKVKFESALRVQAQETLMRRLAYVEGRLGILNKSVTAATAAAPVAPAAPANTQIVQTITAVEPVAFLSAKLGEAKTDGQGNAVKFMKLGSAASVRLEVTPAGAKTAQSVVFTPNECKLVGSLAVTYERLIVDKEGTLIMVQTGKSCPK